MNWKGEEERCLEVEKLRENFRGLWVINNTFNNPHYISMSLKVGNNLSLPLKQFTCASVLLSFVIVCKFHSVVVKIFAFH
jgi:hypothetical protein